MNKIGVFTGKLYSEEDREKGRINECALTVTTTISEAKEMRLKNKETYCKGCFVCEESRKNGGK